MDRCDLFHEGVPFDFIDQIFAVMALCPQHTFQVLTKRPARMREYLSDPDVSARIREQAVEAAFQKCGPVLVSRKEWWIENNRGAILAGQRWPLPNVWLGTSVERQKEADERIPLLLQTPAAVRFLSCEPLLSAVDLSSYLGGGYVRMERGGGPLMPMRVNHPPIRWVICGGESGPGARPMHPDWALSLLQQCQAAGVPYFFKQWGEYFPERYLKLHNRTTDEEGKRAVTYTFRDGVRVHRVGKKRAGRVLDGRTWDEMPEPVR